MAAWAWRTLPGGRIEVDRHDGHGFVVPKLNDSPGMRTIEDRVLAWRRLAEDKGKKYDVPPSWILAVITAESAGDPKAENYCCAGLMAIYYSVHNKTREEMLDPEKNVDYGASLLGQSRAAGLDLPATASVHVAGGSRQSGMLRPHPGTCGSAKGIHPDYPEGSPWGYCEHMLPQTAADGAVGYIDRVVRAHNTYVDRLGVTVPPLPGPSPAGMGRQLLPFVLGAAAGYALAQYGLPQL